MSELHEPKHRVSIVLKYRLIFNPATTCQLYVVRDVEGAHGAACADHAPVMRVIRICIDRETILISILRKLK
jgi:hypothetical protein